MNLPERDEEATDAATCELLRTLVRCYRPAVCVEAGTYRGHAAIAIGQGLRFNGTGTLFTADPHDHGQQDAIREAGLEKRVECCRMDFVEMLDAIGGEIDFAYIDASGMERPKDASLRLPHFQAAKDRLAKGGLVCVHDTQMFDWSDGKGGDTVHAIRDQCDVTLAFGKGLSLYQRRP